MKAIPKLIIVCLTLLSQNVFAQQKVESTVVMATRTDKPNEIVYKKGAMLTLQDFQGKPEPNVDAVAMAYSGVTFVYKGNIKNGVMLLDISVYAAFDKSKSWCLKRAKNEWTLAHEQRHFDITAISACAFFRALKSIQLTKDHFNEIVNLQREYQQQNEDEQDRYDSETNHGINKEKQAEWNEKIKQQLATCADCYE